MFKIHVDKISGTNRIVRMTQLKSATPQHEAHLTLKRLYEERVQLSQAEFGKKYEIGSQSMVAQYLTGKRPLNIEAAAKFARGIGCTIYDISPEMAEALTKSVMPVLAPRIWWRKNVAKFAMLLLSISPALSPNNAEAGSSSSGGRSVYYVKRWFRFLTLRRVVVS